MADKPKCSKCNQRDATHKGLCSGCYGEQWREQRRVEREAAAVAPKQLTSGVTDDELAVIEGEIVHEQPHVPETHLVARSPAEMEAARGDLKLWLEQRLTTIERDIVEANAALNEARRNGWNTSTFTKARDKAVDEETYYNKILAAVEAGHTIIPDFPIEVFAVRRDEEPGAVKRYRHTLQPDMSPAGVGEYHNPEPTRIGFYDKTTLNDEGKPIRPFVNAFKCGPISFPSMTARSPIMRATAEAMKDKVFDQIGVCHPVIADAATAARRVETSARRAGDPLVIGQVLHKRVNSKQRCVSFIIAWHLNLNDL